MTLKERVERLERELGLRFEAPTRPADERMVRLFTAWKAAHGEERVSSERVRALVEVYAADRLTARRVCTLLDGLRDQVVSLEGVPHRLTKSYLHGCAHWRLMTGD